MTTPRINSMMALEALSNENITASSYMAADIANSDDKVGTITDLYVILTVMMTRNYVTMDDILGRIKDKFNITEEEENDER